MYNGMINVYKEKGFTSHDVVAKLRGILKQKKIGHTGTLDPDAEGVLPVCLGSGTKLCDMLTDKNKTYEAVLLLGMATDTQDVSGHITKEYADKEKMGQVATEDRIKNVIGSFIGPYDQIPPMYSAIKVNGKKLYEIAREGKEIERKTRQVHIYSIDILSLDFPRVTFRVECSKGTYIRTLCNDIGEMLGTYGCMEELKRIRSGFFALEDAKKLSEIEEAVKAETIDQWILPVEKMFEAYPVFVMKEKYDKVLENGNPIFRTMADGTEEACFTDGEFVRLHNSKDEFMAVYCYEKKTDRFKTYKMFLEM